MSDIDGSLVERRRRRAEGEEGESYFVSMSDLMAGVLFLFIILLTYFALQLRQTTDDVLHPKPKPPPRPVAQAAAGPARSPAELLQIEADREAAKNAPPQAHPNAAPPPDDRTLAIRRLAADLKAHKVPAVIDEANGTIRLPNDGLFAPGGAALSPQGQAALQALGQALGRTLPCYSYSATIPRPGDCPGTAHKLGAVFIEGHADAPGGQAAGFGLSVLQASIAFQQLIGAEPRLTGLTTLPTGGQPLLSVSGYGPTRPAPAGSGAPNNRLDVKLVMAAAQ